MKYNIFDIDIDRVPSEVLRRLIEEVKQEESNPPCSYDRVHNKHNRGGSYSRSHNRHNRGL